jgi:hypothetical protein
MSIVYILECFIAVAAISQIKFWEPIMTNSNIGKERQKIFHESRIGQH